MQVRVRLLDNGKYIAEKNKFGLPFFWDSIYKTGALDWRWAFNYDTEEEALKVASDYLIAYRKNKEVAALNKRNAKKHNTLVLFG